MVIKYIKTFHSNGYQNVPKMRVWLENKNHLATLPRRGSD
jgi:hypothetical protein